MSSGARPEDVLRFWLDAVGPAGWYRRDDRVDAAIRRRFGAAMRAARGGRLDAWAAAPLPALALVVALDQFPRNVHRDDARAFAADARALRATRRAIALGHDLRAPEPERQFFYLPFTHAERVADQDRGVRLLAARLRRTGAEQLLHARAHREVIRRFGRFPHRNAALGRRTTPAEAAFLAEGGYGRVVRVLRGEGG